MTRRAASSRQLLAMLPGAVACAPEENDYEFSQSIIFAGDDETPHGSLPGKLLRAFLRESSSFPRWQASSARRARAAGCCDTTRRTPKAKQDLTPG